MAFCSFTPGTLFLSQFDASLPCSPVLQLHGFRIRHGEAWESGIIEPRRRPRTVCASSKRRPKSDDGPSRSRTDTVKIARNRTSKHRDRGNRPVAESVIRAKAFKTGTRLYLNPCPNDAAAAVRRYVCCPSCSTAYVGNAVVDVTDVRCPSCSHMFQARPDTLFVEIDPFAVASKEEKDEKRARQVAVEAAPPGTIVCRHFGDCPGCTLSSAVGKPSVAREAGAFAKNALRIPQPMTVEVGPAMGWRTHAKLAVRRTGTGLFKMRSHDVVEIPDCSVHHPAINAAAKALQKAMKECGARSYDEESGKGQVRYALFTVQRESGKVQVTVVWNSASWKKGNPGAPRLGAKLWRDNQDILHSVWFNWNVTVGNTITSQKEDAFYLMYGPGLLRETIGGASVYFAPTVFRQANLDSFEKLLLPRLLSYIPKCSAIVELHGGVGVISLAALHQQATLKLRSVVVTEVNPFAHAPFRKALSQFERPVSSIAQFSVSSDDRSIGYAVYDDADVVIVDPPRAGVSEACLAELANPPLASPLRRLIYVSCGFEAFQRDAKVLISGQWEAHAAHGYILFPGSNHIELLCVFDRKRAS